jgi:two-component system heavy metal sensor histidine kinase CusS
MKTTISLTARLSMLFAGSAACVLLFAGLLFERAANNRFLEHDLEELQGKMALIHEVLGKITSVDAMAALPMHLHDTMSGHPGIAITVATGDGRVLFTVGQNVVVNHLLQGTEIDKPQPVIWSLDNDSYRIVANRVALGIPASQPANVAIALDISRDQEFMMEFSEFLWFGMILAALAMGWLAWVAVRKGLSPLNEVSAMMANISAQRLDMPIPASGVPQELKELVSSFNTMLARLDDSFRRLSEFSSDIAHELRTPIQNLMVQTEVTLTGELDATEYRTNLQSNLEEFGRLSRMISDMLFLAKADNRLLVLRRESIDLHSEVVRLFDFYEALASERSVSLTQRGAATVHADRLMIQRALSNLLSNAIRFTPEGMAVEVTLGETADHQAMIAVANQGTAIPAEHLPRIFDRLYRVDASRQDGHNENVGLGLAITRSIVEMHKGTISVESGKEWTCFTINLPTGHDEGSAGSAGSPVTGLAA